MEKNCVVCGYQITLPICAECLTKQLNEWMKKESFPEDKRKIVLSKLREKLPHGTTEGECLLCGEELTLCPYCYFHLADNILNKLKFSEEIIAYYRMIFNYTKGGK